MAAAEGESHRPPPPLSPRSSSVQCGNGSDNNEGRSMPHPWTHCPVPLLSLLLLTTTTTIAPSQIPRPSIGQCLCSAKDKALTAAAHHDLTTNPQLLLNVVFLHRSTRHHEWLNPLKLTIVPDLWAEQHSGNCRRVRRRVEENPPNGCMSTKEG